MSVEATDVLVVGGGPAGLALSIDLSWRGVRHVLVEANPPEARVDYPRMDQVGIRSMEHFRRLGVVAQIERAGFPRELPRDIVFETAVLGFELAREPVLCDALRPPPAFSPQKHEICPQHVFDPVLQAISERSTVATVRYNTRLVDFQETPEDMRCTILDVGSGRTKEIHARFLAACDGALSTVAARLRIGPAVHSTLARSTNIFIDCPALAERTAGRRAYRHILFGPDGVWGSMVNIDGRALWRLQVLGGQDRPNWSDAEVHQLIDTAIGAPVPYRLEAMVPWTRREVIAERFSAGRCFLVGDAAHQFSPTGGYGMNTGLAEAFDISWKLAAILAGWGGEGLLASYDAERRPVAIRNARQATVNFRRMRETPGEAAVLENTPRGEAVRARVGATLQKAMHDEWDSMDTHLGYIYSGSPIVCEDVNAEPSNRSADFRQTTTPGARAPHLWLGPDRSTLDLFGRGFVLLCFRGADGASLQAAAHERGVSLEVVPIEDEAAARLYERRLVLVRPDGHVCWRGDTAPLDALEIIDRVRGANVTQAAAQPGGEQPRAAQ